MPARNPGRSRSADVAPLLLRCPFAGSSGLELRGCPGFESATVAAGDIDGTAGVHETCAHLGAEADQRGFYPACHHPESQSVVPAGQLVVAGGSVRAERARPVVTASGRLEADSPG